MRNVASTPDFVVNVRDLVRSPGARRHVTVRAPMPGLGTGIAAVPAASRVTIDADVDSVVEGLLVTGEVAAPAELSCVRCLRELDGEVRVQVRELFTLDGEPVEEGYAVLPGDLLPLDTLVRDTVVLALPETPLCRPDCAGLCPRCGADRNVTACAHEAEVDPRWQALADLARARDPHPEPR
ncbi:MAG TPA: DUF177 domain-containing protein [Actinomycetes bacterium]|nr:DUF177 domain-containing protein [Actinomycetes bacterium]